MLWPLVAINCELIASAPLIKSDKALSAPSHWAEMPLCGACESARTDTVVGWEEVNMLLAQHPKRPDRVEVVVCRLTGSGLEILLAAQILI